MRNGKWGMGNERLKAWRLASDKAALEREWGDEWNAETKQME